MKGPRDLASLIDDTRLATVRISEDAPLDLDTLYRAHAQRVTRWATRLGGPSVDRDDVVQEVFVTAARMLPSFRGDCHVTTWLYSITANVTRHHRRRAQSFFRRFGASLDVVKDEPTTEPSPSENVERKEATAFLYRVLDEMRESYRDILILFEIEGMSGEEIAKLTGTSVQSVWVTLHRARAQFTKRMQALEARERRVVKS